jgi:MSHA pilin protein MshB
MKKQSGFTLVELVIVVVILGFLAVTAIPKFLDLTDQAKEANIEGMAGGFATAVSLVRAQWEAEGRPQVSNENKVTYDGTGLLLTSEDESNPSGRRPGYVVGLENEGNNAAELGAAFAVSSCIDIWQGILQQPPSITSSLSDLNGGNGFDYYAKLGTQECIYYLKDSLDRDNSNNFLDPTDDEDGNNFVYTPADGQVVVNINVD